MGRHAGVVRTFWEFTRVVDELKSQWYYSYEISKGHRNVIAVQILRDWRAELESGIASEKLPAWSQLQMATQLVV